LTAVVARRAIGRGLEARFFLFGSRARGDACARSDFDIAVDAGTPLDLVGAATVSDRFKAEAFDRIVEIA
jgi:predicted nucleotidyltransferase